jgi:hypothetical protein
MTSQLPKSLKQANKTWRCLLVVIGVDPHYSMTPGLLSRYSILRELAVSHSSKVDTIYFLRFSSEITFITFRT